MIGEIVNLRRVRKAKARAANAAIADANRARYGQTRTERHARAIESAEAERRLDGHCLVPTRCLVPTLGLVPPPGDDG